ncbi:MAG: tRNA dihydrouridine synthase DusB [Lachnospiraceae bacterium]|jgi:nifR3 family TIM-barrel protein|nr:tRNA dihydrouridine synthase DusB [Lachnospiraceae bacterium]
MESISGFQIANTIIPNKVVLAPMAGVTDFTFRLLCREMGAGLTYMEMISAKAILHDSKKTFALMETSSGEHPISLQLFGSDADIISRAAAMIDNQTYDFLDINMGCPAPKIVNNGEGAALMKDPRLVGQIIKKTVMATKKPVTVKLRAGFAAEEINAVEIAQIAEQSGAAAIAIHGRSRDQFYSGHADWDIIAAVKESVSIPVIGNGDVVNGKTAAAMLTHTGCDAVMVGRAARGNPWVFREISGYLQGKEGVTNTNTLTSSVNTHPNTIETTATKITVNDIAAMIRRHYEEMEKRKGEYTSLREMRKHIAWYIVGVPRAAALRRQAVCIDSKAKLEEFLEQLIT